MAKEKKNKVNDDFNFDDDLNFDFNDDFDLHNEVRKDDRKPITKGLKAVGTGFGKSFVGESNLKTMLEKSLPREYGTPISSAFDIKDSIKDVYGHTTTKTREIIKESKKSINKIATNLDSVLPKKLTDKLKEWTQSSDSTYSTSKEEIESNTINTAFAEIFAATEEARAEDQKKKDAKQILTDQINQKRHSDLTTILGSVDQSLIQLTTYQQKVNTNYLKKSLELQFRSYFVQSDMLQLQTKYFQEFKTDLSAITKNTGLPDYLKKTTKEALKEHLREQTFGSISDTIYRGNGRYIRNVTNRIKKSIGDVLYQVKEGLTGAFDVADAISDGIKMQQEMAADFGGESPSFTEQGLEITGGVAGSAVRDKTANFVRSKIKDNSNVLKTGRKLNQIFSNLPQYVNENINNGKLGDYTPDFLKQILAPERINATVELTKEEDLDRTKPWDSRSHLSLNVIIPKYLAKIHKEIYTLRTGDTQADELEYDLTSGRFVGKKAATRTKLESIFSKSAYESNKYTSEKIFNKLDPENKLTKEEKEDLLTQIYNANDNNIFFNKENILKLSGNLRSLTLENKLKDLITYDKDNEQIHQLSKYFHELGKNRSNVTEKIQYLINNGKHGDLIDLGILDPETRDIDQDRIRQIEISGELPEFSNRRQSTPNSKKGFFKKLFNRKDETSKDSNDVNELKEALKLKEDNLKELSKIKSNVEIGESNIIKLESTIRETNSRDLLTEIRDILKDIKKSGGLDFGSISPEDIDEYIKNRRINYVGKFGKLIGKGYNKLNSGLGFIRKLTNKTISKTYDVGKSTINKSIDLLSRTKERFDLFVGNEIEPRLKSSKLKAGRYIDVSTGKIIEKFEDITGDIKDIDTGEIVLYASEIKDSLLKNLERTKSILAGSLDWAKKVALKSFNIVKEATDRTIGQVRSSFKYSLKYARKTFDWLTKEQQDVYLADNLNVPVLLKRVLANGGYYDKKTGKPITRISEIGGDIVDIEGNVVLSTEDMKKGLVNKEGKPLVTGVEKALEWVKDQANVMKRFYGKVWDKTRSVGKGIVDTVKNPFDISIGMGKGIKKTNSILIAIYKLLLNKFTDRPIVSETFTDDYTYEPGAIRTGISKGIEGIKKLGGKGWLWGRNKIDENKGGVDSFKDNLQSKLQDVENKAREKLASLNKKYNEFKDDKWDKKKELYLDPTTDVMRKGLHEIVNTLRERLPEPEQKKFYDWDGDGIREGSIDDLRNKRSGLSIDENGNPIIDKNGKEKGGLLSGLKNMLLGKMGALGKHFQNGLIPGLVTLLALGIGKTLKATFKHVLGPLLKTTFRWGIKPLAKGIFGLSKLMFFGFGKMVKGLFLNRVTTLLAGKMATMAQAAGGVIKGGLGKIMPKTRGGKAGLIAGLLGAGAMMTGVGAKAGGLDGMLDGMGGPKEGEDDANDMMSSIYNPVNDFDDPDGGFDLGNLSASLGLGGLGLAGLAGLGGMTAGTGSIMEDVLDPGLDPRLNKSSPKPGTTPKPKGFLGRQADKIKNFFKSATDAASSGVDKARKFAGSAWDKIKGLGSSALDKVKGVGAKVGAKAGGYLSRGLSIAKSYGGKAASLGLKILPTAGRVLLGAARVFTGPVGWALLAAELGYTAYKWYKDGKPNDLEKVRMIQYGFNVDDSKAFKNMKMLESMVKKHVILNGNNFAVNKDNIVKEQMGFLNIFEIDPNDGFKIRIFQDWFNKRFIKIYLNHLEVLKTLGFPVTLEEVEKLKTKEAKQYLENLRVPYEYYSFNETPMGFTINGPQIVSDFIKTIISKYSGKEGIAPTGFAETEGGAALHRKVEIDASNLEKEELLKKIEESKKAMKEMKLNLKERRGHANKISAYEKQLKILEEENVQQNTPDILQKPTAGSSSFSGLSGNQQPKSTGLSVPVKPGIPIDVGSAVSSGGDIKDIPMPLGQTSKKEGKANWALVKDTIIAAAKKVGIDPKLAAMIAAIESNYHYTAKAGTSTASGLFQFINSTWKTMKDKYASKWGISKDAHQFDPRANALLGGEFLNENVQGLKKRLKRQPTATDAYMAHFMGLGGAGAFLSTMDKNPNALGAQQFPKAAGANRPVFYDKNGNPKTLSQIYNDFTAKLSNALKTRGITDADFLQSNQTNESIDVESDAYSQVNPATGETIGITSFSEADSKLAGKEPETKEESPYGKGVVQSGELTKPEGPFKETTLADVLPNESLENNPNVGPIPKTEEQMKEEAVRVDAITPKSVLNAPRVTQTTSEAPVYANTTRSTTSQEYQQKQSIMNLGDSISVFKESLEESKEQTTLLRRIVDGVDTLPERLSGVFNVDKQPIRNTRQNRSPSPMTGQTSSFNRRYAPA